MDDAAHAPRSTTSSSSAWAPGQAPTTITSTDVDSFILGLRQGMGRESEAEAEFLGDVSTLHDRLLVHMSENAWVGMRGALLDALKAAEVPVGDAPTPDVASAAAPDARQLHRLGLEVRSALQQVSRSDLADPALQAEMLFVNAVYARRMQTLQQYWRRIRMLREALDGRLAGFRVEVSASTERVRRVSLEENALLERCVDLQSRCREFLKRYYAAASSVSHASAPGVFELMSVAARPSDDAQSIANKCSAVLSRLLGVEPSSLKPHTQQLQASYEQMTALVKQLYAGAGRHVDSMLRLDLESARLGGLAPDVPHRRERMMALGALEHQLDVVMQGLPRVRQADQVSPPRLLGGGRWDAAARALCMQALQFRREAVVLEAMWHQRVAQLARLSCGELACHIPDALRAALEPEQRSENADLRRMHDVKRVHINSVDVSEQSKEAARHGHLVALEQYIGDLGTWFKALKN